MSVCSYNAVLGVFQEEIGWHKKRVLKEEDCRVDFGVCTQMHQIWRLTVLVGRSS